MFFHLVSQAIWPDEVTSGVNDLRKTKLAGGKKKHFRMWSFWLYKIETTLLITSTLNLLNLKTVICSSKNIQVWFECFVVLSNIWEKIKRLFSEVPQKSTKDPPSPITCLWGHKTLQHIVAFGLISLLLLSCQWGSRTGLGCDVWHTQTGDLKVATGS